MDRRRFLTLAAGVAAMGCGSPTAESPAAASRYVWRPGPDLPMPVQEIYPALHGTAIHQAGGFVAVDGRISGPTAAHYALERGADVWSERAPLPEPRHHPQLISFEGRLYAIGGFASLSPQAAWTMRPDVWTYDGAANAWSPGPALPAPNGESVSAVLDGRLHVAAGRTPAGAVNAEWTDHADTDAHYVLAGAGGVWEPARPVPSKRNSAAGVVLNGRWHVIGGRTVDGGNSEAHDVYDPATDTWDGLCPLPQAQGGLAAGLAGGRIAVFGGEYFEAGGGVFAAVWLYDEARDDWDRGPDMPTPRHGLGGVSVDGEVYAIGGARRAGGRETSAAVEVFSI